MTWLRLTGIPLNVKLLRSSATDAEKLSAKTGTLEKSIAPNKAIKTPITTKVLRMLAHLGGGEK